MKNCDSLPFDLADVQLQLGPAQGPLFAPGPLPGLPTGSSISSLVRAAVAEAARSDDPGLRLTAGRTARTVEAPTGYQVIASFKEGGRSPVQVDPGKTIGEVVAELYRAWDRLGDGRDGSRPLPHIVLRISHLTFGG